MNIGIITAAPAGPINPLNNAPTNAVVENKILSLLILSRVSGDFIKAKTTADNIETNQKIIFKRLTLIYNAITAPINVPIKLKIIIIFKCWDTIRLLCLCFLELFTIVVPITASPVANVTVRDVFASKPIEVKR